MRMRAGQEQEAAKRAKGVRKECEHKTQTQHDWRMRVGRRWCVGSALAVRCGGLGVGVALRSLPALGPARWCRRTRWPDNAGPTTAPRLLRRHAGAYRRTVVHSRAPDVRALRRYRARHAT